MQYFFRCLCLFFLISITHVNAVQKWQRVYLATYPRCGNHWMRSLLEEATRITTSSVYRDQEPVHAFIPFPWGGYACDEGLEGNCRNPEPGEIVVIKTHFPAKRKTEFDLQPSIKIIRLVRHPLDSFYSHYLHHPSGGELPENGKIPTWFVERSVKNWKKFENYWNHQPNVLTIRYEDLVENIELYFREILETIGFEFSEEDIQRAITKFLPQGTGELKHFHNYHSKDRQLVNRELNHLMERYGYSIPSSN